MTLTIIGLGLIALAVAGGYWLRKIRVDMERESNANANELNRKIARWHRICAERKP